MDFTAFEVIVIEPTLHYEKSEVKVGSVSDKVVVFVLGAEEGLQFFCMPTAYIRMPIPYTGHVDLITPCVQTCGLDVDREKFQISSTQSLMVLNSNDFSLN